MPQGLPFYAVYPSIISVALLHAVTAQISRPTSSVAFKLECTPLYPCHKMGLVNLKVVGALTYVIYLKNWAVFEAQRPPRVPYGVTAFGYPRFMLTLRLGPVIPEPPGPENPDGRPCKRSGETATKNPKRMMSCNWPRAVTPALRGDTATNNRCGVQLNISLTHESLDSTFRGTVKVYFERRIHDGMELQHCISGGCMDSGNTEMLTDIGAPAGGTHAPRAITPTPWKGYVCTGNGGSFSFTLALSEQRIRSFFTAKMYCLAIGRRSYNKRFVCLYVQRLVQRPTWDPRDPRGLWTPPFWYPHYQPLNTRPTVQESKHAHPDDRCPTCTQTQCQRNPKLEDSSQGQPWDYRTRYIRVQTQSRKYQRESQIINSTILKLVDSPKKAGAAGAAGADASGY
ncbi:hypothetical protein BJY52DRAFT_1224523 [Lactarius psammicola]|nr:hypothetical protein BJY52DRAFT_1224523 [Lactarius psammicola]